MFATQLLAQEERQGNIDVFETFLLFFFLVSFLLFFFKLCYETGNRLTRGCERMSICRRRRMYS